MESVNYRISQNSGIMRLLIGAYTIVLFFIFIMTSCMNESKEQNNSGDKKAAKPEFIQKTIQAELTGTYLYAGPDTLPDKKCTDTLSDWRAIVEGTGTSNVMGEVRAHFDFCGNRNGYYGNAIAYLVDQDSDTLFIDCRGRVIQGKTDEHPDFVISYWKDDIGISGGTGKYTAATGTMKTDDYNSSEDPNSHHRWKGTLKLPVR